MHAVVITKPGGPEVLQWTEVTDPVPGQGEVLVDVVAGGVNRADLMQRQGFYPPPPGRRRYPGPRVLGHDRGPRRRASPAGRSATRCARCWPAAATRNRWRSPPGSCCRSPTGIEPAHAAGLPEAACTVYSNVFMRRQAAARARRCLVHGGASGIGTTAIQLAKALGARVAVTAGSPEKLDACRELGADIAINYRDEDFVERVKDATGGRGADVILDIIGASVPGRNVDALAADGRLVVIGMQGGARAELDMAS